MSAAVGIAKLKLIPASELAGEVAKATQAEHEKIERLAYACWQARGCPLDSPEEDWLRAENEILYQSGGDL